MSNHDRETWPAIEAQARDIVTALGPKWALQDSSPNPTEYRCWEAVRLADKLRVALEWPRQYSAAEWPRQYSAAARQPARLHVTLVWPTDAKGERRIVRTPYGMPEPTTSISMNATKPPATLAREILTRLVLRDGERLHAEALRLIEQADAAGEAQARIVATILAAEFGSHISQNSGSNVIYLGARSHGYTVRVDGEASIRFEAFSVDLPAALRILHALRVVECAQCGVAITEAQAGLSMARADEAPAWCADCCTAYLTAQRAHEEEDPHCTCSDCIARHTAKLDGQTRAV